MVIPPKTAEHEGQRASISCGRTLGAILATTLLAAVEAATLWAVAARRPMRADLFAPPPAVTAKTDSVGSAADTADALGRAIWADRRMEVWSLEFSPNDDLLAVWVRRKDDWSHPFDGAGAPQLVLIRANDGHVLWEAAPDCWPVFSLFAPVGHAIAVPSRRVILLYDVTTGRKIREIPVTGPGEYPHLAGIGFSRDGRNLAWLKHPPSPDNRHALELATGREVPYEGGDYLWRGDFVRPDGEIRGSGPRPFPDPELLPAEFEPIPGLENHWAPGRASLFLCGTISTDGTLYAEVNAKGVLAVWSMRTTDGDRAPLILMKHGVDNCEAIAISHSRTTLAFATDDGTIRIAPLELPGGE
jgi:hypothetical protein